jgi:hypothetical protein
LGPLREFEGKLRMYAKTLGADVCMEKKSGSAKEKAKVVKRKLHWTMIKKEEVDELRAILASEILVVNTLLSIHGW